MSSLEHGTSTRWMLYAQYNAITIHAPRTYLKIDWIKVIVSKIKIQKSVSSFWTHQHRHTSVDGEQCPQGHRSVCLLRAVSRNALWTRWWMKFHILVVWTFACTFCEGYRSILLDFDSLKSIPQTIRKCTCQSCPSWGTAWSEPPIQGWHQPSEHCHRTSTKWLDELLGGTCSI